MIRLSPTTGLNLFKECPKCFWLHFNQGVHRPRGIFPSLPGGMDLVIKKYFDKYRGKLPPEIEGEVVGSLMPDVKLMDTWRNWRTGLEYHDKEVGVTLFGALDDCLVDDNYYIVLDYKTRGYPPKDGDSEKYYQTQLDAYGLMLDSNGYKTRDFGYLVYYFPEEVRDEGLVKFNIQVVKVATSAERAKKTLRSAAKLLQGPAPEKHTDCAYCCWLGNRMEFE